MADLPFEPADAGSTQQLLRVIDAEGKIPRALEAHGPFAGRDVTLFGASPERARWLTDGGARVAVVADPSMEQAWPAAASADVVMAFWAGFDGADRAEQLAQAERLLRPDGQILAVLDYGRDDLDVVRGPDRAAGLVASSRRDGWFLSRGFRIRVIHAFWRFETIEQGAELLRAAYGPAAEPAIQLLRRPRLAHNVAIYQWTRGASAADAAPPRTKPARRTSDRPTPNQATPAETTTPAETRPNQATPTETTPGPTA